jgi:mono/diheme cytochrome c family protein
MPAAGQKITRLEARELVAYIRSPASRAAQSREQEKTERSQPGSNQKLEHLEKNRRELQKQFYELSNSAPDASSRSQDKAYGSTSPAGTRDPKSHKLFATHCVKCHGEDGTGSRGRRRYPEIPNFTDSAWQSRRRDAQLLASILDGMEQGMPSWRDKISKEQAAGLVAYIRAFRR